jgi:hypothetical protein
VRRIRLHDGPLRLSARSCRQRLAAANSCQANDWGVVELHPGGADHQRGVPRGVGALNYRRAPDARRPARCPFTGRAGVSASARLTLAADDEEASRVPRPSLAQIARSKSAALRPQAIDCRVRALGPSTRAVGIGRRPSDSASAVPRVVVIAPPSARPPSRSRRPSGRPAFAAASARPSPPGAGGARGGAAGRRCARCRLRRGLRPRRLE